MNPAISLSPNKRIESIDLLRGVVMVIMALDHVRDYFMKGSFFSDPSDLATTTPTLFFTRFITHYCAPCFIFLAGTSAFLYGQQKSKTELFKFLLSRGLWLIFLEFTLINFLWRFDLNFGVIQFIVIWTLGASMIFLSLFSWFSFRVILISGVIIVFGSNMLDGIMMEGSSFTSFIWYLLHQPQYLEISTSRGVFVGYPLLPWIGLMLLGYCFGRLYSANYDANARKKLLTIFGIGSILLFCVLRGINLYGDPNPWSTQKDGVFTLLSFMKVTKYPVSLDYLLITMGPAFLFLRAFESSKSKISDFFLVFGKVPFFYYVLHIFSIHVGAILLLLATQGDWQMLIYKRDIDPALMTYGYPLWVTYLVWIILIAALYPLCKTYMNYKANNKSKWWLSYL